MHLAFDGRVSDEQLLARRLVHEDALDRVALARNEAGVEHLVVDSRARVGRHVMVAVGGVSCHGADLRLGLNCPSS